MAAKKPKAPPAPTNVELDASGRQLFDAVLREPENVEARLVYSDWLMEHADPRGEFIQLQCALNRPLVGAGAKTWHRPLFDGDPAALVKRERALIKLYEKQWLLEPRPFIRTWRWSRGFVDHVVADTAKFLDGAATIFGSTPLVDVQLTALKKPMLQTLTDQPTTARLRALNLFAQKLDADALTAFESPTWNNLEQIKLAGNHFGHEGVKALARARGLKNLTTLLLNDALLTDADLEELVKAPFFSKLVDIELGWNEAITGRGALLVAKAGTSLKKLRLRTDVMGLTVADWEAVASAAPQLEYVEVGPRAKLVKQFFAPHVVVR